MRNIMFCLVILLICSCSNNRSMAPSVEDSVNLEFEMKSESFTLEELAVEKLHSYFELLKIQKEHPEFQEDVLVELRSFSEENFNVKNDGKNFMLQDVKRVGDIEVLSDSLETMKLQYVIGTSEKTETDSIKVNITTKTILLDGEEIKSRKVTFSSLH